MSNSSDPPKDLNKNFDPLSKYAWGDLNPILTQISTKKDKDKGKIIDIIEVGYQLGEKIIRYPKVVVGK